MSGGRMCIEIEKTIKLGDASQVSLLIETVEQASTMFFTAISIRPEVLLRNLVKFWSQ